MTSRSTEIITGVLLVVGVGCLAYVGYHSYNEYVKPARMAERLQTQETRNDLVHKIRSGNTQEMQNYFSDGLDPNTQLGTNGQTLLIIAAQSGNLAAVKKLLEAGADPAKPDRTGLTAVKAAEMRGHKQIAVVIQAAIR